MINIEQQTDSRDGKLFERQLNIFLTDLLLLAVSFGLFVGFEWIAFCLADYREEASSYIKNLLPITFFMWGSMWIALTPLGIVNPKGNHIQATHNPLSPEHLPEGGTRFIIYQTGIALKYLWERKQGTEIQVENEVIFEGDLTTVSIKKISLQMKLSFLYRVYLPNLSSYLQNSTEENGVLDIIKQLKAASNQYTEEAAAKKRSTEEVREDQTSIINTMLERLRPEALHFGINVLNANFSVCDYSIDTQKELNKLLEARVIQEIADEMDISGDNGRKYELAAVNAGKPGAKITRSIFEVVMTPEVAHAAEAAGPAAVALLASLGKKTGGNNQ